MKKGLCFLSASGLILIALLHAKPLLAASKTWPEINDAYANLRRQPHEAWMLRQQSVPGRKVGARVCGMVELAGMTDHQGVTVEIGGTDLKAITDSRGNYCLPGLDGPRNVIAWKSGWSVAQVSSVHSAPVATIPTMVLHAAPGGIKAALLGAQFGNWLWVSTSLEKEAGMMADYEHHRGWWIGGIVRKDPFQEHGFYFDPATIHIAEFVADFQSLQTTIPDIQSDLEAHKDQMRFIAARFLEYKPLRPPADVAP